MVTMPSELGGPTGVPSRCEPGAPYATAGMVGPTEAYIDEECPCEEGRGGDLGKQHEGSNPMSFTYDAADRAVTMLQGSGMTTFSHDSNGNMTQEYCSHTGVNNTFVFDQENRLINELRPSGY